ncbi:MAG: rRNA pseudouridine synthase [Clostridia bacterium]|nr:rRNA pseudouridine synthase [Clostridia bacterium]
MRLDKFFSDMGLLSRRDCARAAARGEITVNGAPVTRADAKINEEKDEVFYRGERVAFSRFVYVMLHKPQGYISATEDGNAPVVTELLPDTLQKRALFPCGRLDKDTTGFLLLTDDGTLAHLLLSPKRHVSKCYAFSLDAPLPAGAEERFAAGVRLGEELCKSALLSPTDDRKGGTIVITEGKYHQIKRMMQSEGCTVTALKRTAFAGIPLDEGLAPGEWRYFTDEEIATLEKAPKK